MKEFLISLVPSLGALFLLWVALRAIFQADRRERAAMARYEAEQDRAGGARPAAGSGPAREPDGAPPPGTDGGRDGGTDGAGGAGPAVSAEGSSTDAGADR